MGYSTSKIIPTSLILNILVSGFFFIVTFHVAHAQTQEELTIELQKIQAQIEAYEKEITTTAGQKKTLANKIAQLKKEQQKIASLIKASALKIKDIGKQIISKEGHIKTTETKLQRLQRQLGDLLKVLYQTREQSWLEIVLSRASFSVALDSLAATESVSQRVWRLAEEAKETKRELEGQKKDLSKKKEKEQHTLKLQTLQQTTLVDKAQEQQQLLQETQGKESTYQALLADSKKRAQEIRSRLYELLGVAQQITFGEAAKIATWVSSQTGVRAALLLAVLTQESKLGVNVGLCNRPGDPEHKSWRVVMKASRDHEPFLAITKSLGMNPDITPVSCPMYDKKGNKIGFGGAIGPAQFIPSTWMGYSSKISAFTGKSPANPWDIRDAFIATALYLKNKGATAGTTNAEWRAALSYFAGSPDSTYRFYADNVMAIARGYEDDLKTLSTQ